MKTVRELAYTVRAWLWTLFWIAVFDEIILGGKLTSRFSSFIDAKIPNIKKGA